MKRADNGDRINELAFFIRRSSRGFRYGFASGQRYHRNDTGYF